MYLCCKRYMQMLISNYFWLKQPVIILWRAFGDFLRHFGHTSTPWTMIEFCQPISMRLNLGLWSENFKRFSTRVWICHVGLNLNFFNLVHTLGSRIEHFSTDGPEVRICWYFYLLFSGNLYVRTTWIWLSEWCWSLSSTPRNSPSWSRWRGTSPDTSLTKGTTTNYFYSSSDKSHRLVLPLSKVLLIARLW